ncbi:MFS transporter [Legionella sp. km772]|uniref:MFS transporter n=1 Tax=Legionella sp. km772 TaxID=2498111 RepID=UPI000F8F44E2|nr:MFS transporter [Legionella sp. km772]RUR12291.1 MFS transporter [Legionella sp. km772]
MEKVKRNSVLGPLFGNALEWYDFLIYASFASVFAEIFFPSNSHFISLVQSFSLFAMGFVMRPIGGVIIGHYADHRGRKKALIISMCIMTISTFCIGLVPDFKTIGVAAPILFSLFRLIQGLAIGGELPGSVTYLIEQHWAKGRGLSGSLVLSSAFLGILLGSLVTTIFSGLFSEEMLLKWGWRIPYFLGGIMGVWGIYLRINSVESRVFNEQNTKPLAFKSLWFDYKKSVLLSIVITSVLALGNYLLIAYVTTFLVKAQTFALHEALAINLIALFVLTLVIPIMGYLSDHIERKRMFIFSIILFILLIIPFFFYLGSKNWWVVLAAELMLALILAPINAIVPTMIGEMFPVNIRGRGVSLTYNIGQALFGGSMPLIALSLIHYTGNTITPGYYILFWALIAFVFSFCLTTEKIH